MTTETEVSTEIDALSPEGDIVTLESGTEIRVERLKTRGLFKLLRVLTRGAGPALANLDLNSEDTEAFVGQLIAVVVMAVPEAEDEAIDFIKSMVVPVSFIDSPKSKLDKQVNDELLASLSEELDDPEIMDTLNIITTIVRNEAEDIQSLGKRLMAILNVQR